MPTRWFVKLGIWALLLTVLLFGAAGVLAAPSVDSVLKVGHYQPPPPPPPVPPTATPVPATTGNGGTGFLAILDGFVWEEGDPNRPVPEIKVRYVSDGVTIDAETNDKGYFRFLNIGPDGGVLDLADSRFQSGTGGVVVKPPLGLTIRVNLAALAQGKALKSSTQLEAGISPGGAAVGQSATFAFKIKNMSQGVMSGLMLGWQLPEGLAVSNVRTSRGDVLNGGSNLVAVDLNTLAAGDSATVDVVVLAKDKAATPQDANRATLLYREGAAIAVQTTTGFGPMTLPVTGLGAPVVAVLVLVAGLIVARRLRLGLVTQRTR